MLRSITHRKMLNPTTNGINIKLGNSRQTKNHYTILVGLFHKIIRVGFFNQDTTWQTSNYILELHPYLPLMMLNNYGTSESGIYLRDDSDKENFEKYSTYSIENEDYTRPTLLTLHHSKDYM